jgi:histone H3/H4
MQNIHGYLLPPGQGMYFGGGTYDREVGGANHLLNSNDGATDRTILAYEALEECASGFGSPIADTDPVIGQQVAWRLARCAGVKFLDEAVAPMLSSLADSVTSGVLRCAIATAASSMDTDGYSGSATLEATGRQIRVDVLHIRRSIKAEPFLLGQECVGVGAADETVFRVSEAGHSAVAFAAPRAASAPPAASESAPDSALRACSGTEGTSESVTLESLLSPLAVPSDCNDDDRVSSEEEEEAEDGDLDSEEEIEKELDLLTSVERLSAANLRSVTRMSERDKEILLNRIKDLSDEDFQSVKQIVEDAAPKMTDERRWNRMTADEEDQRMDSCVTTWRLLNIGAMVSMQHLNDLEAALPAALWAMRSFADKIDPLGEIEELPLREMPVRWVQHEVQSPQPLQRNGRLDTRADWGGRTGADSIALRRIFHAQRGFATRVGNGNNDYNIGPHDVLPILPADRFEACALALLSELVAEATGIGAVIITSTSLAVLRLAVEERLVQLLEGGQLAAIHAKRCCVRPIDLRFVIKTCGTCLAPGALPADAAADAIVTAATLKLQGKSQDDGSDCETYESWAQLEASETTQDREVLCQDVATWPGRTAAAPTPTPEPVPDAKPEGEGESEPEVKRWYDGDQEDHASMAVLREIMVANSIHVATAGGSTTTMDTTSCSGGGGGERGSEWGCVLPHKAFEVLVRSVCHEAFGPGDDAESFVTQFKSPAILALQVAIEGKMHTILYAAALAARYRSGGCERTGIEPVDVQLARRLLHQGS